MEKIIIDGIGSVVNWEGPGTYVSMAMRGKGDYYKMPDNATPNENTWVITYGRKPDAYVKPVFHPLWTINE